MRREGGVQSPQQKAVTFDVPGDVGDSRLMTPFRAALKAQHDAKHRAKDIKSKVYLYMREHRYDDLATLLRSCAHAELSEFCDRHGAAVFNSALQVADTQRLICLLDNIPAGIVQEVFRKDHFELLGSVLGGARFREDDGRSDVADKALLAAKIDMVLEVTGEDVRAFIRNNANYQALASRGLRLRL